MSAAMMRNARTTRTTGRAAAASSLHAVPRPFFSAGCNHTGPCACRSSARKAGRCAAAAEVATAAPAQAAKAADLSIPKEHDLGHR